MYPKQAYPLTSISDELLDYFSRLYEHDERGAFPLQLLDNLPLDGLHQCGLWHCVPSARPVRTRHGASGSHPAAGP